MNPEMRNKLIELNANPLVRFLEKLPKEFTRSDIVDYVKAKDIKRIHFRYCGFDGKLNELKLPINNLLYLERILAQGERIDGSNPFKGVISGGKSDLYIVPLYHLAFQDYFDPEALHICCRTLGSDGKPLNMLPDTVISKAHQRIQDKTGIQVNAMVELEFFLIEEKQTDFPVESQKGYHAAYPFVKGSPIVDDILNSISSMTGHVKYCHSEVGFIHDLPSENPELNGKKLEQFELEFLPAPIEDMAFYAAIAKWAIRIIAYENNQNVTFAPKLNEGDAGSGLHVHLELMKDGKNIVLDENGELGKESYACIGGLMKLSKSLTAFGNTVSASYLRLKPHQEAPTKICWGKYNRSSLVRVPLGWNNLNHLAKVVNPQQADDYRDLAGKATFEFRVPDGSANIYLLLAGLSVAIYEGLTDPETEKLALEKMVIGDIFAPENADLCAKLEDLPMNCWDSAQALKEQRAIYEKDGIFTVDLIDNVINQLEAQNDKTLYEDMLKLDEEQRIIKGRKIMHDKMHLQ